jgi:translocation and assembly module TamB
VSVRRERGDVVVDTATDASETLAIGILALEGSARLENGRLSAKLRYASERGGRADADATLEGIDAMDRARLDTAPLAGRIVAALPSIAVLQPWLGTTAAVDGRIDADLLLRGTFGRPVFAGTLGGQALRMDSPRWGLHFDDGRLAARVDDSGIVLDSFSLRGGEGRFEASGQLARAGRPDGAGLGTSITWRAERLRVLNRPDLRIVASGDGRIELADRHLTLAGRVNVDEGAITYERTSGATLSPDVVVKGRAPPPASREARASPLRLDLVIDLGNKLQFDGAGLEARLAGRLALASAADGRLEARGAIRAVNGVYYAFGQRLDLARDRARIVFDGPVDNPALDIVAMRANIPVEAGIELTGSVRVPRVTLISNPPMSDGERLAWIITGQGLASSNNAELAAISAASAALLGRSGMPITTSIARQFGIDDVSIRTGTAVDDSGAEVANPVVSFGKRLSDRLSLVYEQGITVATNTLRLEYALTRAITLRAETGTASGVGIGFRRSFE